MARPARAWGKALAAEHFFPNDPDPKGIAAQWFGTAADRLDDAAGRDRRSCAWQSTSTCATWCRRSACRRSIVHRVRRPRSATSRTPATSRSTSPARATSSWPANVHIPWARPRRRRDPRRDPRVPDRRRGRRRSPTACSRPSSSPTSSARPSAPPSSATGAGASCSSAITRRSGAQLERFRGREIDTAGDGFLASFDGPARAIRCARRSRRRRARARARHPRRRPHGRVRGRRRQAGRHRRAHRRARGRRRRGPARCSSRARCAISSPAPGIEFEDRGVDCAEGRAGRVAPVRGL